MALRAPFGSRHGLLLVYIVLLVCVAGLMAFMRGCADGCVTGAAQTDLPDTVRVGMVYGRPGFGLYADTLGGVDYDMLRAFAAERGIVLDMRPYGDTRAALAALRRGEIGIAAPVAAGGDGISLTPAASMAEYCMIHAGRSPLTSSRLAGDTVLVAAGSPVSGAVARLGRPWERNVTVKEIRAADAASLADMVLEGKARYAVVSRDELAAVTRRDGLAVDSTLTFTLCMYWGLREDSPLLQELGDWVGRFTVSPAYVSLLRRYRDAAE